MGDGTPDPTDATWQQNPAFTTGSSEQMSTGGGIQMAPTTPQPPYDPDEAWCELPPLNKVSPAAAFDLIESLRKAGVPVLGPKPRRSGLFSGGKVDVTLSVPDRLRSDAMLIVVREMGTR